jgi:hypothetical protein
MKNFIHNVLAVFMSVVVLMTTMSFTVDMHYCGDSLIDFSFIQQVESCGMEKQMVASSCGATTLSEKSCCTDKTVVKEGNEDLKISFDRLTLDQHLFIVAFTHSLMDQFTQIDLKTTPFVDYPPPFLERDVQVLHQSFLI